MQSEDWFEQICKLLRLSAAVSFEFLPLQPRAFLVQGTYKKWISLKRKFRVEFFKSKSEDANSREASCTFPYFEALKFLIPYCEVYKL